MLKWDKFSRVLDAAAMIAFIAACIAIVVSLSGVGRRPAEIMRAPQPASPSPASKPISAVPGGAVSIEGAAIEGGSTARVAVIEYSDFQCPYCGAFARDTLPTLRDRYVRTGQVLFAFRNLPLEQIHPHAFMAAEAADCARAQGKFWQMHDLLFHAQESLDDGSIRKIAGTVPLQMQKFDSCLAGPAAARVASDAAGAKALKISGTPVFLVGRIDRAGDVTVAQRISGAKPLKDFEIALDGLIGTPASETKH
jgi:protein-disulfide isomerase